MLKVKCTPHWIFPDLLEILYSFQILHAPRTLKTGKNAVKNEYFHCDEERLIRLNLKVECKVSCGKKAIFLLTY